MTAARHSTKNFAVVGLFNPHHLLTMPSLHLLGEKENEADRSEGMCPSSQLEEGGARCEIQAVRLQRRPSQTLPLRDSGLSDGDVGKLGLWRITHSTPWNTPIYNSMATLVSLFLKSWSSSKRCFSSAVKTVNTSSEGSSSSTGTDKSSKWLICPSFPIS